MADNSRRDAQVEKLRRYADLIARESGKAVRPYRADGFVNLMTKYGTSKDPSEQYKYVPELQVPDSLLTLFYEGNGLFAKIIDAPAEEAVKHGFTLEDVSDQTLIDFYQEALEELDFEETAMTAIKWARLYGGSIAVMLINDGRGLEEPLDWSNIRSIDDIRVYDRSVIQPDYDSMFSYDPRDPFRTRGSRLGMPERYQVFSKYGTFTVHDSRCLVFRNGVLPEGASNSVYQFWGQPEYVRINKAIRDAEVAHGSAPKLLDRSVQAIYKMRDLSAELATEEGEDRLLKRLQIIDMARGMMNSIAIDSEGEEYDFKTFQFSGVNDVIGASCNMLSAVSNIPQVILFGQKVGGLGNGDDTSMENWYNYVERIDKRMLKGNTRYLLSIIFQAGLATGEVDEVPKIKVSFNPLWSMSDTEKADLELKREQVKLAKAQTTQVYVSMQALDPTEVRKKLADSDEYDVEKILDEYEDEDLFPPDETPSPDGSLLPPGGSIPEQGSFAGYAEGVDLEAHNADPQEEGNGPDAAPAATKLPQDMSQEELETAERRGEKLDSGGLEDFYAALKRRLNTDADNDINESVGVIVVKDGKILCGVRDNTKHPGQVCGPGGHLKAGESYEQAAFRETEEEFGISPKELIPLGFGPREDDTGMTPAVFLCTDYNGEPYSRDGEMMAPVFRSMEELMEMSEGLYLPFAASLKLLEICLGKETAEDGGPGSGNFGHKGVKGQLGGSAPSEKPVTFNTEGKKKTEITKETIDGCKQGSVVVTSNGLQFVKVERNGKLVWITPIGGERDDLDSAIQLAKSNPSSIALYEGDGSEPEIYIPSTEGKAPGEVTPDTKVEMPEGHRYGGHDITMPDWETGIGILDRIKENIGCDDTTAGEIRNAFVDYSGVYCGAIKQASETGKGPKKYTEPAEYIDKYCEEAPTWNGGTLYRGVTMSQTQVAAYKQACEVGEEIDMHGISSWSSDRGTAVGFGKQGVVFICENGTTWGSSIKGYSKYTKEDEVLVSSKARYRIKDYYTEDGVTYFTVIENNPRT